MSRLRLEDGTVLATQAVVAETLRRRLIGWLNRTALTPGEALVIPRCNAIHTWFMQFPIDVVFLNREQRVMRLLERVPPFRLVWTPGAQTVIELPAGTLTERSVSQGDALFLEAETLKNS